MGLTFQQLQKYEHGTNRISGSRLYQLSMILHVPYSYFFGTVEVSSNPPAKDIVVPDEAMPSGLMHQSKTLELLSAFYVIEGAKQRDAAFKMISAMSGGSKAGD